ncbi:MAG: TonB-dependent receptor [Paludibacter sp.]|jgi:outer membrane receptor for ferrienterochelin and colicin|nr:TonB-dependent receptor [Paludibacter sp.]
MKAIIINITLLFSLFTLQSQIKGRVADINNQPLAGANILWLNTQIGAVADADGYFTIPASNNHNTLIITYVGYVSDTVTVTNRDEFYNIVLRDNLTLGEVSIERARLSTLKSRQAIVQTEKINSEELFKAACCNLSESFETNPSVDVSYSDAATGAKQIKLLGLSGSYVQMMTENIPNLRGIASVFGLGYIPGSWMESIQISKGTASVINGYEAITGQINVEYKKPDGDQIVHLNAFGSDAGRVETNANAAININSRLTTGVFLHYSDEFIKLDQNNDNFMDMPMIRQYNFANRWKFHSNKYEFQAFVRALSERRMGGQIDGDYHIGIDTKRYEFFVKNGFLINAEKGESMGLIISGSIHNQDAEYGHRKYEGNQDNLYANLIYATSFGEMHKLTTGASINFDKYAELLTIHTSENFPRKELAAGTFAEYTFNYNDKFIALAGARIDENSLYGTLFTPRLHLKYNASEHFQLRASVGRGFRSPNILAENNNLLASNRILNIDSNLKMEESWNYGISFLSHIDIFNRDLTISGEYYHTQFVNQVIADMDSDPHAVHFQNLDGQSYSRNAQIEANMEVLTGLTITAAHRIMDVKTTIAGVLRQKPLTSRYKSLITATYQTPLKKWQFDFTAQFNGGGRLPDPDAENPLWEKTFKPYTVLNAQITKNFKTWSVYGGSENITNFVQANAIIDVTNPNSGNFDASLVWGPLHGRKFYVGLRWSLDKY